LGSRTEARSWIGAGRVSVNGRVIQSPDHWVDLERDKIALDGKPIQESEKVYLLLYKPKGYLTTYKDPEGRPTVYDLLPDLKSWVFLVAITVPINTADHVFTICHNLHKTNVN